MQFNVLGTLEVLDNDGRPIDLGGAQPRAVLVSLLIAVDRVVLAGTIIDRLWPDNTPTTASGTLQSYISRLRRVLDPKSERTAADDGRTLAFESQGYRFHPGFNDVIDFVRFEALADGGRELLAAGEAQQARDMLTEALGLWRGPALVEFSDQEWARGTATRLDTRRTAALDDRIRADLQLGRHELVLGELTELIASDPLHEGFRELLAIALYRSGRQAEALRALDDLRRRLVDELGIDPSQRIRELETRILDHDPTLASPVVAPAVSAATERTSAPRQPLARAGRHVEGMTETELVGRAAERRVLADVVQAGLTGITQWVVLEGEPGIGKTRLLEQLAHDANGEGYQVLWGRCFESGAPPAFWLWLAIVRGLVDPADPLPDAEQELIDRLLSPAGEQEHVVAVDAKRFRLFEAISALLKRAAHRQPVMLALDDVQWADPASLELIEFVTGSVIGARVIVACTVRQFELARNDAVVQALATISRRPHAKRLQLHGLNAEESAALARLTLESDLAPDVLEAIHRRSEGNPFFLGELARLLVADEGLTAAEQVRRAAVPAGVRDVVHRRLVRLPAATIELVQVAATIGRGITLGLLSRAAGVPIDQCVDDLEPAFVTRLIVESDDGSGAIRFAHALVREVVLDDISMLRRSRLHLRVADAIEAGPAREDDAEIIAEHLWQAATLGVEVRAATALERAAEIALQRFAYESADTLLERAIQLRSEFPPDRADPSAELDALNRLIQVRRTVGGFEAARLNSPIQRAKALARATQREAVLVAVLWTEWAGACTSCDFALARQLSLELRELGTESTDPIMLATGESCWGILCWHLGKITEAVESLDRASEAMDSAGPTDVLIEQQILARCFHAAVHAIAGDVAGDDSPLPALASAVPDPYAQLVLWVFEGIRGMWSGEFEHARRAIARARVIDLGEAFALFGAGALSLDGCLKSIAGEPVEGASEIERGAELYTRNGVYTFLPFYYSFGVLGLAAAGHLEQAESMLDVAQSTLQRTGELWQEPFVRCAAARLLHATTATSAKPSAAVTRAMREAHEIAIDQGALGSAAHVARVAAEINVSLP